MTRRVRSIALGSCLALLLTAGLAVLLQSGPRRAGTNLALVTSYSIALAPGQELCQPQELVPADTAGLRLSAASSGPTGTLTARVLSPTGPLVTGRLAAGWRKGRIEIPVGRVRAASAATVCVRNEGASTTLFGGTQPDPPYTISLAGRATSGRVRLEYMRPGNESWLEELGVLSYRFSLGRSTLTRSWAVAAVLVLMLGAVALTARMMLAEGDGER